MTEGKRAGMTEVLACGDDGSLSAVKAVFIG